MSTRRRVALIAGGVLAIGGIALYLVPVSDPGVDELYAEVDGDTVAALTAFRAEHRPAQVEVDGQSFDYVVLGSGPPVLLLHGMGGAHDIWFQQLDALADTHTVAAVTYPPVPSLSGMADGVLAVLDAEQLATTSVVGSSLGGYLAQYLVQQHPERIERAVFANTFPPNDVIREDNRVLGTLLPVIPEWLVLGAFRSNIEAEVVPAASGDPLVAAYLLEQGHGAMSKAQFVARYRAVIDPFEVAPGPLEGRDILLIEADNDPLVAPQLRTMLRETYPHAQLVTLEGVGHFPYLNEPERYTQVLRDFLDG